MSYGADGSAAGESSRQRFGDYRFGDYPGGCRQFFRLGQGCGAVSLAGVDLCRGQPYLSDDNQFAGSRGGFIVDYFAAERIVA